MLKKIVILSSFAFCLLISANAAFGQKIVTAAQVNGTWREVTSNSRGITTEFLVYSLGKGKLKIEFVGNNVPAQFNNTQTGTALIEGNTTMFQPDDTNVEDPCMMTLKFANSKLIVMQKGECGFGRGIEASGTYTIYC